MWTRYNVRWEFLTSVCGSVPADPELQRAWLESRRPRTKPPQGKSIDEIAEEVYDTTQETDEPEEKLLMFQRFQGALVVGMRTLRAHIKDVATVLSSLYVGKIMGERSFAVRCKNALYYPPEMYWVPLLNRDGKPITEPSGKRDKPVHMMTPQGPRSAIKTIEFVNDAVIEFPLLVLTQPSGRLVVSEADLKTIFMYGGTHGYGGERSDGEGRYVCSLTQTQEA